MKIWKRLKQDHIFLDVMIPDKESIFRFVADICVKDNIVQDWAALYNAMLKREKTMSTGIGGGIGLPHAVSWEAEDANIILIRLKKPIDFDALDKKPVDMILAMIIPGHRINLHLQLLAGISRLCKNDKFLKAIRNIQDIKQLWLKIKEVEEQMAFH